MGSNLEWVQIFAEKLKKIQVRSDAHISVSRWCSFTGPSAAGSPVMFETLVERAFGIDTLITRGHRQQCLTLSMREGFSCETLVARGSAAPVCFHVFGKTCRACPWFERAGLGFRILLTKLTALCFVLTARFGKHTEGLGVLGTRPMGLVGQACCLCVHFCH